MRPRLARTALLLAAALLVGATTPASADDPVAGQWDPADERLGGPPNDYFADAVAVTGTGPGHSTLGATLEGCEALPPPASFFHPWQQEGSFLGIPVIPPVAGTLWWKWTPKRTRWVVIDTGLSVSSVHGVPFDTILGVYRGRQCDDAHQPGHLRLITWDDDSGRRYQARARFWAVEGAQYYIAVQGGGDLGLSTCWLRESAPLILCNLSHEVGFVVPRLRDA